MINSNNNTDNEPTPQQQEQVTTLPPVQKQNVWKKRAEESKFKAPTVQQQQQQYQQPHQYQQQPSQQQGTVKEKSSLPYNKFHKPRENSEHDPNRKAYQKDNKPFVKKEFSPEEKLLREEKTKAFNLAQEIAIKKCVDRCNPKVRDDINGCLSYEVNYRRTLVMDITDDDIVVDVDGNKHVYSLKRFLENRYFQNKLRDEYTSVLPEAWIRFPGRDEGTFCIGIQRRKS